MNSSIDAPPARVLTTECLTLRRLAACDAGFILELLNDPAFIRYIGDRNVRTLDDARTYIANGPEASYARFGFGLFLVTLTATDTRIGICGLLKRDALEDVDLGFAFLPAFRLQGYAREAALGCKAWAVTELHLRRLVAIVQPDNTRSTRLLETIGFACEKTVRLGDGAEELALYGCALD